MTQAENVYVIPEAGGFSDLRVYSHTGTKEAGVKNTPNLWVEAEEDCKGGGKVFSGIYIIMH